MSGRKHLVLIFTSLIFSILFTRIAQSQPLTSSDIYINFFWDFYSNNRLSTLNAGKGYTGIAGESDISGIQLNPASLNLNKRFQAHVEYLYKSNVPWGQNWIPDVNLKEYHPSLMAAFGYKFNDYFQTGLLYYTANSYKLDFGEFIETNEFGQEIGEFEPFLQMSISSIALPVVFNYKDKLKAGVNLLFSFYHGYDYFGPTIGNERNIERKANFNKFNEQFGIVVLPIRDLSLGITFTPKVEQNVVWENSSGSSDAFVKPNVFPMHIGVGSEYRFRNIPLKLAFDYNYYNSYKQEGLNDRNDFHFGAEYAVLKSLSVRTGFFTLKDYRSGANYIDPIGQYDEYFITLGGTYKIKGFSASVALMDSHILSTGLIKQTLVNGGITMDFK
jgi:hypothetical protein